MTTRTSCRKVPILYLSVTLLACSDTVTSPVESRSYASAATTAVLPTAGPVGTNELFLRISERLPSFAGLFVGPSGRLTVLLQDEREQEVAPEILRDLLTARTPSLQLDHFTFAPARFTFRELWDYRLRLAPILNRHAVNGVAVHSSSNQIVIDSPSPAADLLLTADIAAAGIPSAAVRMQRGAEKRRYAVDRSLLRFDPGRSRNIT